MNELKKIFRIREVSLLVVVVIFILILSLTRSAFLTRGNIFNLFYSVSVNSIIGGAMTVLFVSGGFDMSVGATLGFCSMALGWFITIKTIPIPISVIFIIIIGAVIGLVIGYIVAYLGINPFITTLAAWFIIESFTYIVNGGRNIVGFPDKFSLIASYKILNIPIIIIFSIMSLIIFGLLLWKNVYFRNNYYIGGNETAAKLAGISVKRIKLLNYTLVSTMSAVASIFITSRYVGSYAGTGKETAFQVIAAVIIGGASLKGGRGTVIGTFIGLVLMFLINNALVLYGVNLYWNKVSLGIMLLIVVYMDVRMHKGEKL